jgi:hypothetical protein
VAGWPAGTDPHVTVELQVTGLLLGHHAAYGADAIIRPVLPRLRPSR